MADGSSVERHAGSVALRNLERRGNAFQARVRYRGRVCDNVTRDCGSRVALW